MKKCAYCDFLSGVYDKSVRERYTKALCEELRLWADMRSYRRLSSVYIGGGTPSWLELPLLSEIMETVRKYYIVENDAEITIECNPGSAGPDIFKSYTALGINRVSLGLQSANDDELLLLGRIHNFDRFLHTYEYARNAGFYDINVDVMTGLPAQTPDKLLNTLKQVLRLRPQHISTYSLIIEEGTPFYDKYKFDAVKQHAGMPTEMLPTEDQEYELGKIAEETLKEHGYERYEISNYCLEGYACRHNVGYWTREEYLGVGLGAASLLDETRYSNERDIYKYMEVLGAVSDGGVTEDRLNARLPQLATEQHLGRKAQMEEFMFLGLRMPAGVTRERFKETFGIEIDGVYAPVMEKLRAEGLLTQNAGVIRLTEKGLDLSNYALAEFLID